MITFKIKVVENIKKIESTRIFMWEKYWPKEKQCPKRT